MARVGAYIDNGSNISMSDIRTQLNHRDDVNIPSTNISFNNLYELHHDYAKGRNKDSTKQSFDRKMSTVKDSAIYGFRTKVKNERSFWHKFNVIFKMHARVHHEDNAKIYWEQIGGSTTSSNNNLKLIIDVASNYAGDPGTRPTPTHLVSNPWYGWDERWGSEATADEGPTEYSRSEFDASWGDSNPADSGDTNFNTVVNVVNKNYYTFFRLGGRRHDFYNLGGQTWRINETVAPWYRIIAIDTGVEGKNNTGSSINGSDGNVIVGTGNNSYFFGVTAQVRPGYTAAGAPGDNAAGVPKGSAVSAHWDTSALEWDDSDENLGGFGTTVTTYGLPSYLPTADMS